MFKPLSPSGWAMSANPSPLSRGGIHDTFHVDSLGNLNGLHTTVQVPNFEPLRMDVMHRQFERQTTLGESNFSVGPVGGPSWGGGGY